MSDDLEYSLGLKVEGFNQGAKEVIAGAKEIGREMQGIRRVIEAGGVATVAIAFLRNMSEWAETSGNKLDDNVQALLRWKAAAADTGGIKSAIASLIQPFISAGETIGLTLRAFAEAGSMKGSLESPLQYIRNLGKAWEFAVDTRAKSIDLDKQEAATAPARQQALEAATKVRTEGARLAERERSYRLQHMTAQERVNALSTEYLAVQEKIAAYTGDAAGREELHNQYRSIGLELLRAQDDVTGLVAEKTKEIAVTEKEILAAKREAARAVIDEINARENAGLKHAGETVIDEIHGVYVGRARGKDEFANVSDAVLEEILRRNQERISAITQRGQQGATALTGAVSGYFAEGQAVAQISQDSANARAVLDQRRRLGGVSFEEGLRNYEGDPLNFERLYRESQGTRTAAEETNTILRDLKRAQQGTNETLKTLRR